MKKRRPKDLSMIWKEELQGAAEAVGKGEQAMKNIMH
jgi:hypothetical protein